MTHTPSTFPGKVHPIIPGQQELSNMERFTFTVTVDAAEREQAEQVMAERIGHDEDYGFNYTIGWITAGQTLDEFSS